MSVLETQTRAKLSAATKENYLHIAISLLIFFAIRLFLNEGNGLTDKGVSTLALFVATIWLWIFVGVDWPSLLVPGALIALGVMNTTQALAVSFGNLCFAYVVTTMLINVALEDSGVIERVATWFISAKVCKGRPWVFLGMFLLSCVVVEFFLDCVPVTLIYLVMADRICQMLGYEKGSRFGQALVFSILVLVIIPYGATPISHVGAVLMMSFIQAAGYPISVAQYMAIGVPFSFLALAVVMLLLRFLVRPDFSKFAAFDTEELRKDIKPLDTKAKISIGVFCAIVFCWLAPDIMKAFAPSLAPFFSQLGLVAPPTLGVALLCIMRVKNEPILNLRRDLYKIPHPTLIFIVGIQAFAAALTDKTTGVSLFLGNLFTPIAHSVPESMVVWIACLIAVVVTQCLSNIVVINLIWTAFLPVILALNAAGGHINVAAFGVILCITANIAFVFPSASVVAPMNFTSGYLEVKHGIKYGTPAVFILYLVLMAFFLPIANAIF